MSGDSKSSGNSGCMPGVSGMLLVAFVVMKLAGIINWSWWWVLSPLWISVALTIVLVAIALFLAWILK